MLKFQSLPRMDALSVLRRSFADIVPVLRTSTVNGSTATLATNLLAAGTDSVTAVYAGDSNFISETSAPLTVMVAGTPGFTMSGGSVALNPGASTGNTATITVAPVAGFTGKVTLTAALTSSPSGSVDPPSFSFGSTNPVSISGMTSGTAVLTIATTAPATSSALRRQKPQSDRWIAFGGTALACLLLAGIPARCLPNHRHRNLRLDDCHRGY